MKCHIFADPIVEEYLQRNKSLHNITCEKYFLCSNGIETKVLELFPEAKVILSENNLQQKFIDFINVLPDTNDVLMKIDADTIVYDFNKLEMLSKAIQDGQIWGNQKYGRGSYKTTTPYIRGAAHLLRFSGLKTAQIQPFGNAFDLDIWLAHQLPQLRQVDRPLFEISDAYSGVLPCWHPTQYPDKRKLEIFKREISKI